MSFKNNSPVKDKKKTSKSAGKVIAMRKLAKKMRDDDDDDASPKEVESLFAKHAKRLRKLERRGVTGEAYDVEVLKSMRLLVLDLIPVAEENYRKFPIHTAASALNQYINQEREIINDIRALEDFQARAQRIVAMIGAEYQAVAKVMIENVQKLQGDVGPKHATAFKDLLRTMGKELKSSQDRAGEEVMKFMVSTDQKK